MTSSPDKTRFTEYAKHAADNEIEILRSKRCGCFFCRHEFDAKAVHDWVSDRRGTSALCPECGMDAVIGDASGVPLTRSLLKEMSQTLYGDDYMETHPEAARTYVDRYVTGKIVHKAKTEALFLRYLGILAEDGDDRAALVLGDLFAVGDEFVKPDLQTALAYYSSPALASHTDALCARGTIWLNFKSSDRSTEWSAYECFSKAAALGSLRGVYYLSTCYFEGIAVEKDARFAFDLLNSAYPEALYAFCTTGKEKDCDLIRDYAEQMGKCYEHGIGVNSDMFSALRYYLVARLAAAALAPDHQDLKKNKDYARLDRLVGKLASKLGYFAETPVFDQDTFYDSFCDQQDGYSPKAFDLESYDEESGELHFSINFAIPPLIIDVADLFCAFCPQKVHWHFTDVASFNLGRENVFERIVSPDGDTWRFEHVNPMDGSSSPVGELRFKANPEEVKAKLEKKIRGKGETKARGKGKKNEGKGN